MHRLFVALRPPVQMREPLMSSMEGVEGARWQSAEQLHCTLRFIGEVERPLAEDIALSLGSVRFDQFELALDGIGRFAKGGRPRALWAGLTPHDRVRDLHKKIDTILARLGVAREGRAYLPHITIARLNVASGPIDDFCRHHAGLACPPCRFTHFHLYSSTLGSEGAIYETVARYPLDPVAV